MPFVAIDPLLIEAGDPVIQELWDQVRLNFDDHESRLTALEGGVAVTYMPLEFELNGSYYDVAPLDQIGVSRVLFDIDILSARLLIKIAGTSGSTEIDFKYKRGANPWTSIFATKPSVVYSAGDFALSSNGVLSVTNLLAGDLIRMDLVSAQVQAKGFVGIIEFEKV